MNLAQGMIALLFVHTFNTNGFYKMEHLKTLIKANMNILLKA